MSDRFHYFSDLTAKDAHDLATYLRDTYAAPGPDPDGSIAYVTGDTGNACHDFPPGTEVVIVADSEDDYLGDGLYHCEATDGSDFYWVSCVDLDVEPPRLPAGTRVRVVKAPYLDVEDLAAEYDGPDGVVIDPAHPCGTHTCYGVDLEGDGFITVYASKVEPLPEPTEAEPPRRKFQLGDRVRVTLSYEGHEGIIVRICDIAGLYEVLCPGALIKNCALVDGAGTYCTRDLELVEAFA